jgi:hypothetical protein
MRDGGLAHSPSQAASRLGGACPPGREQERPEPRLAALAQTLPAQLGKAARKDYCRKLARDGQSIPPEVPRKTGYYVFGSTEVGLSDWRILS